MIQTNFDSINHSVGLINNRSLLDLDIYNLEEWKHLQNRISDSCFGFLGVRSIDFLDFIYFIPISLILVGDYGTELRDLERNTLILSPENDVLPPMRRDWTIEAYDRFTSKRMKNQIREFISLKLKEYREFCFLCYGIPQILSDFQKDLGMTRILILSSPSSLRREMDSKILQYIKYPEIWQYAVPFDITCLSKESFSDISSRFGTPFVVHTDHGDSGYGTYICKTEYEYAEINLKEKSNVVISKYIEGFNINTHGCIITNKEGFAEIVVSQPSIQIVGIQALAHKETVYCGNDFGAIQQICSGDKSRDLISEIVRCTTAIGKWLAANGWRGIFGIDMILGHDGNLYPIDTNPRLQGSTQLLTESCLHSNMVPITFLHTLEFFGIPISARLLERTKTEAYKRTSGSLLVIHSKMKKNSIVSGNVKAGVYIFEDNTLIFKRIGYCLFDCRDDLHEKEFLLTSGVPENGTVIGPHCPILEIQSWHQVIDLQSKNLNPWAKTIVNAVINAIDLKAL
jgi:hypothetical protein